MGYINFALDIPQLPQCIVNNPDSWVGHWTDSNYWSDTWFDFDGVDKSLVSNGDLMSDSVCSFKLHSKNQYGICLGLYKGSATNPAWSQQMSIGDTRQDLRIGYICLVNTDTGKAHFSLVGEFTWRPTGAISYTYPAGNSASTYKYSQWQTADDDVYTLITHNPLVNYNWLPITSLTGKGVTKGLSILKDTSINGGNAVNDGTASDFTNNPLACNVGDILANLQPIVEEDPTKVAVKYTIPDLTDTTYTSVKLVVKKNKIPKNKTDGDKIIDLSPSSGGVVVSGLEQLTKYYFVIFVEDSVGNKAESEPKDITTGKKDGILFDRISVMQAMIDSGGIKDNVSVTQV